MVSLANQPTMSPDALTGPGRALQGLGRAIAGLGDDLSQPSDKDVLAGQLAQMDAQTESQKYYQERVASLTPDTDPDTWHQETTSGINDIWSGKSESVPQNPKLRQNFEVNRHRFVGDFDVRAHGLAVKEKTERFATGAVESFRNALDGVDPTSPEGRAVIDTIDQQLRRVPGLDAERARGVLAEEVSKRFEAEAAKDPVGAIEKIEGLKNSWGSELPRAAPDELPREGLPGSQSGPTGTPQRSGALITDEQKTRLANVRPELIDKFAELQGETGQTFKINSGYRDPARNARVGGARKSQHTHGNAIDIDVSRLSKEDRVALIGKASSLGFTGIGVYENALHLDLGNKRAWGPSHGRESVPKWAEGAIAGHLSGKPVTQASGRNPDTMTAVTGVAQKIGANPDAIGAVFTVESGKDWNPKARTGSYMGVSQIGKTTLAEMGVSVAEYANMSQAEQATFYGKWLDHYKFSEKMQAAGIDFANEPPARQAAILQAFQFAPNGSWVSRLGKGDTATPVTNTKQARVLGSTSIADMEKHFVSAGVSTRVASRGVQVADASGNIPQSAMPQPVAQRSLTQYAGMTGQAPDKIGQDTGQNRTDTGQRAENTIPGAPSQGGLSPQEFTRQQKEAQAAATPGEVRVPQPKWAQPSIRTHLLDKIEERLPAYYKARSDYLDARLKRIEAVAGDGYLPPEQEHSETAAMIAKAGTPEQQQRLANAEQAAVWTSQRKALRPAEFERDIAVLRADMAKNGATPELLAKAEAAEKLQAKMTKELADNAVGWASEAGAIPPQVPITPETFTPENLARRAQAANDTATRYGLQYKQFFSRDEREALEATFNQGGETMLAMMQGMYQAFGDDTPLAVKEIAPKAPEAARAGYLLATGGDPQAVEDIAATIQRRADPNYKESATKFDRDLAASAAADYLADFYDSMPRQERDATMRAAEAIYEARVKDPATFDEELFKTALGEAVGERSNGDQKYGGIVQTKEGWFGGGDGGAIVLPSNVRQDSWKELFNEITLDDLKEAGLPPPIDGKGKPVSITKVLGGQLVSYGPGRYVVQLENEAGTKGYVMQAPNKEGESPTPFVLDFNKLSPILRRRVPSMLWAQ